MSDEAGAFCAIVLAGSRGPTDPVATAAGVPAKCLTPIAGEPMVLRVLRALERSGRVASVVLCGPNAQVVGASGDLSRLMDSGAVRWVAPAATPSTSAGLALDTIAVDQPVLLTTGDHALLSADMVRHFLDQARMQEVDVAVALAPYPLVRQAYPRTRRTVLRFSDGGFCGCNLFAFLTPRARSMAQTWRQVENDRKNPIRVIGLVGWWAMLLYALGRLSLAGALRRISRKTGLRIGVVVMPFAEVSIDVDSVADLELVREIVAGPPQDG